MRICMSPRLIMVCIMPLHSSISIFTDLCLGPISILKRSFDFSRRSQKTLIIGLLGTRSPLPAVSAAAAFYFWHIYERLYCIRNVHGLSTHFVRFHIFAPEASFFDAVKAEIKCGFLRVQSKGEQKNICSPFRCQTVRSSTVTCVITSRSRSEPTMYSRTSSAVSQINSLSPFVSAMQYFSP